MHLEHASGDEVELQHGRTDGHTDVDELAAVDHLSGRNARARMTGCTDSGDDASPETATDTSGTLNGPQAANLGDGAIGRLSERQTVDALLACLPMHEDGTGHVVDCGFDWEVTASCGCASLPGRLAAIVREHTERAWDEVVQMVAAQREAFLDSPGLDPAWISGWHAAIDHATHTSRAARQETNR